MTGFPLFTAEVDRWFLFASFIPPFVSQFQNLEVFLNPFGFNLLTKLLEVGSSFVALNLHFYWACDLFFFLLD